MICFLLPHILLLVHAASKIIGRTELTNLPTKNNMRVTHDKFHIDDSCCFLLLFGSNFSSIRISYFEMKSLITTNERGGNQLVDGQRASNSIEAFIAGKQNCPLPSIKLRLRIIMTHRSPNALETKCLLRRFIQSNWTKQRIVQQKKKSVRFNITITSYHIFVLVQQTTGVPKAIVRDTFRYITMAGALCYMHNICMYMANAHAPIE